MVHKIVKINVAFTFNTRHGFKVLILAQNNVVLYLIIEYVHNCTAIAK